MLAIRFPLEHQHCVGFCPRTSELDRFPGSLACGASGLGTLITSVQVARSYLSTNTGHRLYHIDVFCSKKDSSKPCNRNPKNENLNGLKALSTISTRFCALIQSLWTLDIPSDVDDLLTLDQRLMSNFFLRFSEQIRVFLSNIWV